MTVEDKQSENDVSRKDDGFFILEYDPEGGFPTPDFPGTFRTKMFSARHFGLYQVTEVHKWLKACVEDFPDITSDEYTSDRWFVAQVHMWFERWLSQFRGENSDC